MDPRDLKRTVPAEHFIATIAVNVDNAKLSDAEFREFIRNTLPIVDYPPAREKAKIVVDNVTPTPYYTPTSSPPRITA